MSRLRLLALIEAYSITGPAKNLLEFARLAHESEVETTIATFTRGAATNLFIETARKQGTPVEIIEERGLFDRNVFQALRAVAGRVQPDLLQTHAVKSHFLTRCAGLHRMLPWIAFHHGYTWPTAKVRLYNQLDRWSLPAAKQVLTVSIPFREELIAHGVPRERIEIIHNAIRPDWGRRTPEGAAALRAQLGISPDKNVLLIVGRLSREKDHVTLLRTVAALPPETKPHLVIVGGGPEEPVIRAEIRRLGIEPSVTLTGHQGSAEPYYGIANVAVLSSLSEGSPNALLEAMAAGVPIVATRVGGIPEIVSHEESALLVEPGNVAGMTRAVAQLLSPDRALADTLIEHSRRLVADRHSPALRVSKLIEIYRATAKSR